MKWSWYESAHFVDPTAEDARQLPASRYFKPLPDSEEKCSFTYGGQCERSALCEVYGLPFCESHGPEAAAIAMAEERSVAHETISEFASMEIERFDANQYASDALVFARDRTCGDIQDYDRLLEKLPLRHSLDLIDADCKRRLDNGRTVDEEYPEDEWRDRLRDVLRVLRMAWSHRSHEVLDVLEPLRQEALSQLQIVMRYSEVHKERIYEAQRRAYESWSRTNSSSTPEEVQESPEETYTPFGQVMSEVLDVRRGESVKDSLSRLVDEIGEESGIAYEDESKVNVWSRMVADDEAPLDESLLEEFRDHLKLDAQDATRLAVAAIYGEYWPRGEERVQPESEAEGRASA